VIDIIKFISEDNPTSLLEIRKQLHSVLLEPELRRALLRLMKHTILPKVGTYVVLQYQGDKQKGAIAALKAVEDLLTQLLNGESWDRNKS